MTVQFIHLRNHTEFSIVDGILRIKPWMQALADDGMAAVALTDQSNGFAVVKFFQAAMAKGVKPIIGADIYIENPQDEKQPFSLVLLCQNDQGYDHLRKIISLSYTQGQHMGKAIVKKQWLEQYHHGLIALSAGITGDIGQAIIHDQIQQAEQLTQYWQQLFNNRFYLEVQRIGVADEEKVNHHNVELALKLNLPLVATNNVRFLTADDYEAHEARVCINQGYTLDDPKRPKLYTQQQYCRSQQQMLELFADLPEALANTVQIAKRCNVLLKIGETFLPNFPIPAGMTTEEFFAQESRKGLEQRLSILYDTTAENFSETRKAYDERLEEELVVINKMGFPGYFLIVADFIDWAKNHDVPVGPGRGSGAGSLVAYVLGITDLDPLEYDLLFERFLNPERVSLPDFDVDFCMEGRDRVIEYVAENYGRDSVSQIITYGTMAAKAVVRDVGRVLGHPYGFVDKVAKLIPFELGITLDKALEQEQQLAERYEDEAEVKELIDLAKKLEGVTRNAGKHAGGVVIAPSTLSDFAPLYCEEDGSNVVTQFDKDDVEKIGLVKFDFLGLRTLTIIHWAVKTINTRHNMQLDMGLVPVDDKATFELLKACNTTAVFQLESRGMKDLIKRLQPDCFEDIIALVALFRPGPLQSGMVDDFIDRKHGRADVAYPHPDLEPILSPTYGVILYQEQVMQIAQVLAGYTLGGADLLRRAMGKKKPEEMAKQRITFVDGAINRGVERERASYIFDLMEKFAGYGFNKSHSAAYALVAYHTAWLKAHYPAEFMAAVLSSDMDNTDKVKIFYDDCQQMGLKVLAPDINSSQYQFTVNDAGHIVYGLGAIKGAGEAAIESMIIGREQDGAFKHFFDFCDRIDTKKANRRVLEALVKSGSADCFNIHRASLAVSVEKALKLSEKSKRDQTAGQMDLFAVMEQKAQPEYVNANPWDDELILQGEKETLGFYLSGHPLDRYQQELQQFISTKLENLPSRIGEFVKVAGFIEALRIIPTKRGDRMAFVTLSDNTGKVELAIFSDILNDNRDIIVKDQLVVVEGDVSTDDYSGGVRMGCKSIFSIDEARNTFAKHVLISMSDNTDAEAIQLLQQTIKAQVTQGNCPITINYQQKDSRANLKLGDEWRVCPSEQLIKELKQIKGIEEVEVDYA